MKRKLKLENDENYLEPTQLEKIMNHPKKNELAKIVLKKMIKNLQKKIIN